MEIFSFLSHSLHNREPGYEASIVWAVYWRECFVLSVRCALVLVCG